MKVLIGKNKQVIEISDKEFPVHPDLIWVDTMENVQVGQDYINGVFIPIPKIEKTPQQKRDEQMPAIEHKIDALWDAVANGNNAKLVALKAKIDGIT